MNERAANTHSNRFGTWLDHHGYSIVASFGRMLHKPWATLLTVGVMALALALPLGLWVVLNNAQQLGGDVQSTREVAVYLKLDVRDAAAQAVASKLRARADVADVTLVQPNQALGQLRRNPDLATAIDALGEADAGAALPVLLRVVPRGDERTLATALQSEPEVDHVQFDAVWRERLQAWLNFAASVVNVLALLLGIGALLVVGNTVRLDIQSRRDEIGVLQLLGASDGFVRRPFLYLGAWYGLLAGAVAIGILMVAWNALQPALLALVARYGSDFVVSGLTVEQTAGVVLVAGGLGWLGAGLVAGHYLRQTRPVRR